METKFDSIVLYNIMAQYSAYNKNFIAVSCASYVHIKLGGH